MSVVYDSGVLVGADRNVRQIWADHRVRLELGIVPVVTAPVVSQVSRSARQVQMRRFLQGCDAVAFSPADAHAVGELLARARQSDVVDAHVVTTAATRRAVIVTSDIDDLAALGQALDAPIRIVSV